MAPQITGDISMTNLTRKQLQERRKQQLRERKKQRRHERNERQLQERKEQQLQARRKQQQLQRQFIAEFVRRLREAPDGTRVYMRCDDVFAPVAGCDGDVSD
jgi:chromosome condensin MukBEF ATPase and DNA-binding subunit MukB